MILVYSQRITNRITYSVSLMLETILGMDWQITDDAGLFARFEGARIQYGGSRSGPNVCYIHTAGFLHKRGILPFTPDIQQTSDGVVLFPDHSDSCDLGFDVFSASFYMASRYEEYLPAEKDHFGRFEAAQSLAYKAGFLHLPVVEHYAIRLRQELLRKFPMLTFTSRSFKHIPTIDVDIAYAFKGRGVLRTLYGTALSAIRMDFKHIMLRFRVLSGKARDPFDTYDALLRLHKQYRQKAIYFFLCGDFGPYDKNIGAYTRTFQRLVRKMGDYAQIGVHPSMGSHDGPQQLLLEIQRLANIINQPITLSRQHFLKIHFPTTYQHLIKQGIVHDYSMGFASQPGFRAGLCTPYPFYDLTTETATKLIIVPLTIMDGTLRDYLKLSPAEAMATIRQHVKAVKEVNGTFVSLWHNDAYSNFGDWHGWSEVYDELMRDAGTDYN